MKATEAEARHRLCPVRMEEPESAKPKPRYKAKRKTSKPTFVWSLEELQPLHGREH